MLNTLDAIIIGSGPSGLGASLALSGLRPHYSPACAIADHQLQARLDSLLHEDKEPLISHDVVPRLAANLRGRSNNPMALLFDALQHPGVDQGRNAPSCLKLQHDTKAALSHIMLDPQPPGGTWHGMHDATKTLSPGTWMELPGYSLAAHLRSRGAGEADAERMASQRQPRSLIAGYYEAAAKALGVQQYHRPQRVVDVRWEPADADAAAAASAAQSQSPPTTPARAASAKVPARTPATTDGVWVVEAVDASSASRHQYRAHALLLAIGTSGRPRRLGIEVRHRSRNVSVRRRLCFNWQGPVRE